MSINSQLLFGFGRTSRVQSHTLRPEFISDLIAILKNKSSYLPRGCGRSYGDEALNAKGITIFTERLNRFIAFDSQKNILICESGVTLRDIQNVFLPRNIGLMTSPGTAWVSVGGAIANDVHGKNHDHVGSFSRCVMWFDLLIANQTIIRCSRDENSDIFFATIGGLGLTGIITTVCLQLQNQSNGVTVTNEFIPTISALLSRLNAIRDHATYQVAWLDLSKKYFGRSILSIAEPAEIKLNSSKKIVHSKKFTWLLSLSSFLLNDVTMSLFNQVYYRRALRFKHFSQSLQKFLYPLDALTDWNYLYGKNGFYQFQCVIPDDHAEIGITEILTAVRESKHVCYLAVLKTLGSDGEGLLSFSQRGFSLALDFPNKKNIVMLLKQLEAITVKYRGRIYLAKDACLSLDNFHKMYNQLPAFQQVLNKVDPDHYWQSELSRRLQIRESCV